MDDVSVFLEVLVTLQLLAATVVNLDVQALAFAAGVGVPILVGVVTRSNASSGFKAVLNFLLSAVAGALAVAIEAEGVVDVGSVVLGIGSVWVVSVATYYGLLKPTGVSGAVQRSTASFGVGGTSTRF